MSLYIPKNKNKSLNILILASLKVQHEITLLSLHRCSGYRVCKFTISKREALFSGTRMLDDFSYGKCSIGLEYTIIFSPWEFLCDSQKCLWTHPVSRILVLDRDTRTHTYIHIYVRIHIFNGFTSLTAVSQKSNFRWRLNTQVDERWLYRSTVQDLNASCEAAVLWPSK